MKTQYTYEALASRVLVVACWGDDTWMVYIDAVPGECHDTEFLDVVRHGTPVDIRLAKILFPSVATKNLLYKDE